MKPSAHHDEHYDIDVSTTDGRRHQRAYRAERREARKAMLSVSQKAYEALHKARKQRASANGRGYQPSKNHPGWTALRVKQDGSYDQLPPFLNTVFKACREFIDNPQRFPMLAKWACMQRKDTRTNVAKVLVVLLARCDLIEGRVGVPTEEGMSTLSHDELMKEYVLRWGEMIEDSKYYKIMRRLRDAGILSSLSIRIEIPGCEEKTYRSAASFKQLSLQFFQELKVTSYPNIAIAIHNNRAQAQNKGLFFHWIEYARYASQLILNTTATLLNETATPVTPLPMSLSPT